MVVVRNAYLWITTVFATALTFISYPCPSDSDPGIFIGNLPAIDVTDLPGIAAWWFRRKLVAR